MAHRRPLDPRRVNVAIDANALDLDGTPRDRLVERFKQLMVDGTIRVVTPGGVRSEVQHPHTPGTVQAAVLPQIFNLRPGLNTAQQAARTRVAAALQGNARPGKHAADASHISEADETGCGYFITHETRILRKRSELYTVLSPSLNIVTLTELFEIFDAYEAGREP